MPSTLKRHCLQSFTFSATELKFNFFRCPQTEVNSCLTKQFSQGFNSGESPVFLTAYGCYALYCIPSTLLLVVKKESLVVPGKIIPQF